jgi:hypothetical protein
MIDMHYLSQSVLRPSENDTLHHVFSQLLRFLYLLHNRILELLALVLEQFVLGGDHSLHVEELVLEGLRRGFGTFGFEVNQKLLKLHFVVLVEVLGPL